MSVEGQYGTSWPCTWKKNYGFGKQRRRKNRRKSKYCHFGSLLCPDDGQNGIGNPLEELLRDVLVAKCILKGEVELVFGNHGDVARLLLLCGAILCTGRGSVRESLCLQSTLLLLLKCKNNDQLFLPPAGEATASVDFHL